MELDKKGKPEENSKDKIIDKTNEGSLLWDEYKYRHDLIWRHLIRSTLALVSLLIVRYATDLNVNTWISFFAWLVALVYIVVTYITIKKELDLYDKIKAKHRDRQSRLLDISHEEGGGGFSKRVRRYMILLLIGVILMGPISLCLDGPKIGFSCENVSISGEGSAGS